MQLDGVDAALGIRGAAAAVRIPGRVRRGPVGDRTGADVAVQLEHPRLAAVCELRWGH
jgi:hypothetical protein